nr:hypothetical protein [Escherichia coli]
MLKGRGSISSTRQRAIYPYFEAANADEQQPLFFYIKKDRFDNHGYDQYFYDNTVGLNGIPTLNTYTGKFHQTHLHSAQLIGRSIILLMKQA